MSSSDRSQLGPRRAAAWLLVGLAACGGAAPSPPQAPPAAARPAEASAAAAAAPAAAAPPALRSMVLLDETGPFFRAKGDPTPVIARAPIARPPLDDRARVTPLAVRAMDLGAVRLVENHGDWLEIETLPVRDPLAGGYCQGAAYIAGLGGAQLRLFVPRTALTNQVLTAEHEAPLEGGGVLRLKPGVFLSPTTRADTFAISVHGVAGRVEVPAAKRGVSLPTAPFAPTGQPAPYAAPRGLVHGLSLGTGIILATTLDTPGRMRITHDCLQADVTPGALAAVGGVLGGLGMSDAPPPAHVKAGAELYWRGGQRAGTAVYPMPYDRVSSTDGPRQCVESMSAWREDTVGRDLVPTAFVELCADPAAVVRPPAKRPGKRR